MVCGSTMLIGSVPDGPITHRICFILDSSTIGFPFFQESCERATQFASDNPLTRHLVMNAQMELSRIRNDLIDSKIIMQRDMSVIRNHLTGLQSTIMKGIEISSDKSYLQLIKVEVCL